MNAGMYGLPNGQALQGRRLAAQLGRQTSASSIHTIGAAAGAALTMLSLTAGVRTQALGVTGRGALRFVAAAASSSGPVIRVEVVVDGVTVADYSRTASATGDGAIAIGACGGSSVTAIWDWIPFDSSAQVFVTNNNGGNTYFLHVTDIHQ